MRSEPLILTPFSIYLPIRRRCVIKITGRSLYRHPLRLYVLHRYHTIGLHVWSPLRGQCRNITGNRHVLRCRLILRDHIARRYNILLSLLSELTVLLGELPLLLLHKLSRLPDGLTLRIVDRSSLPVSRRQILLGGGCLPCRVLLWNRARHIFLSSMHWHHSRKDSGVVRRDIRWSNHLQFKRRHCHFVRRNRH